MIGFPEVVRQSGPFGLALLVLGGVVLVLTVRGFLAGAGSPSGLKTVRGDMAKAVLFWGVAAAVLGALGQAQSAYLAMSEILQAPEIDPRVVAQGFVMTFFPSLIGMGILGFSFASWFCLRSMPLRSGFAAMLLGLLLVGATAACTAQETPSAVTDGVWSLDAGGNVFLWEFSRSGEEVDGCSVHDLMGGRLNMVTPCTSALVDGQELSLAMPNGVRYQGTLDLARGRVDGALLYTDGSQMEAVLHWAPRGDYPTLSARAGSVGPYTYSPPQPSGDGIPVASATDVGVAPAFLEAAVDAVARGEAGILKSLLVLKDGKLVLEEYFHGYGPDDLSPVQSCTKSVSSLLTGLAIQEGAIADTDAPLLDFFPDLRSAAGQGWESLTLENLLTMSLALDWSPEEAQGLHGTGPEAFREILARNVAGQPGEDWEYVNMNVNLLAGVIHSATGEYPEAFASRTLFGPLGIETWHWDYSKTDGYNLMDGSLQLRPRDMAKIGQMMLNGGRWNGVQIVSEDWVEQSLRGHLPAGSEGEEYGYLWWRMVVPGPGGMPVQVAFANGWGSQFILLFPDLDLVVVTTGGNQENGKHLAVGEVLVRDLLPGVGTQSP